MPVFFSTGSCSFSNRTSASCFGELMLNSPPASAKICARSASRISRSTQRRLRGQRAHVHAHARPLDARPASGTSGSSRSRYTDVEAVALEQRGAGARPAAAPGRRVRRRSRARRRPAVCANGSALAPLPRTSSSVQRLVAQLLERQRLERLARAVRVEQVAGQHRVERQRARSATPCRPSTISVDLEVVADLRDRPDPSSTRAPARASASAVLERRRRRAKPSWPERHVARRAAAPSRRRARRASARTGAAPSAITCRPNAPGRRSSRDQRRRARPVDSTMRVVLRDRSSRRRRVLRSTSVRKPSGENSA